MDQSLGWVSQISHRRPMPSSSYHLANGSYLYCSTPTPSVSIPPFACTGGTFEMILTLALAPLLDLGHYPKSIEDKAPKFTEEEWKLIKGSSEL
jgi:hypothetical protein